MRICFDLDGVICEIKKKGQSYSDVMPIDGATEKIRELKEAGHYIIINTARHMKTCSGNTGLVIAKIGQITMDWLTRYDIPYDELHFGKPWAQVYIDDNAFRFSSWSEIDGSGSNLPTYNEAIKGEL
ncbi:capsular biosynthesis protein [Iodobacter fluviatilis]|uniref:Capsule biosynthesis phosphatase n=1 Tax=Iodobacter fluviatilis TaxID=537 RepID=A0A377SVW3_9NEIS|nr:capsular biosynthesis protein [Iodobacter fluviatilis]TCU87977.1 capsule biosynthesis phosphatase [Iodobacter fluviatilis]STR45478.1 capsule biosynthesis phosphatase [Iodobacter fluviatilis]